MRSESEIPRLQPRGSVNIRTILVPALMHLFGRRNWWLPGWLDARLPHLSVEPADESIDPELLAQPVAGTGTA